MHKISGGFNWFQWADRSERWDEEKGEGIQDVVWETMDLWWVKPRHGGDADGAAGVTAGYQVVWRKYMPLCSELGGAAAETALPPPPPSGEKGDNRRGGSPPQSFRTLLFLTACLWLSSVASPPSFSCRTEFTWNYKQEKDSHLNHVEWNTWSSSDCRWKQAARGKHEEKNTCYHVCKNKYGCHFTVLQLTDWLSQTVWRITAALTAVMVHIIYKFINITVLF